MGNFERKLCHRYILLQQSDEPGNTEVVTKVEDVQTHAAPPTSPKENASSSELTPSIEDLKALHEMQTNKLQGHVKQLQEDNYSLSQQVTSHNRINANHSRMLS